MTDLLFTSEKLGVRTIIIHQTVPVLSFLIPPPCQQLPIVTSSRMLPFPALVSQICNMASLFPGRSDESLSLLATSILKGEKKPQPIDKRVQCRYLKRQLLTAAPFSS